MSIHRNHSGHFLPVIMATVLFMSLFILTSASVSPPSELSGLTVLRQSSGCSETCYRSFQEAKDGCYCYIRTCNRPGNKVPGVICTADSTGKEPIPSCKVSTRSRKKGSKFTCKCSTKFVKKVSAFPRIKAPKDSDIETLRDCFKQCMLTNQFGFLCGSGILTKKIIIHHAKNCCKECDGGPFTKNKFCTPK